MSVLEQSYRVARYKTPELAGAVLCIRHITFKFRKTSIDSNKNILFYFTRSVYFEPFSQVFLQQFILKSLTARIILLYQIIPTIKLRT